MTGLPFGTLTLTLQGPSHVQRTRFLSEHRIKIILVAYLELTFYEEDKIQLGLQQVSSDQLLLPTQIQSAPLSVFHFIGFPMKDEKITEKVIF